MISLLRQTLPFYKLPVWRYLEQATPSFFHFATCVSFVRVTRYRSFVVSVCTFGTTSCVLRSRSMDTCTKRDPARAWYIFVPYIAFAAQYRSTSQSPARLIVSAGCFCHAFVCMRASGTESPDLLPGSPPIRPEPAGDAVPRYLLAKSRSRTICLRWAYRLPPRPHSLLFYSFYLFSPLRVLFGTNRPIRRPSRHVHTLPFTCILLLFDLSCI